MLGNEGRSKALLTVREYPAVNKVSRKRALVSVIRIAELLGRCVSSNCLYSARKVVCAGLDRVIPRSVTSK